MTNNHLANPDIIGLLPAGGQATRISPLPVSKELYPIGFHAIGADGKLRPKVVCHYLLEKMRLAGIHKAFVVLRPGKWDIPSYLGDGKGLDMRLGYLTIHVPFGIPYTLDQAYPFIQTSFVALGFPDILFEPQDAFVHLVKHQAATQADVVLGLFPTEQYQKAGMVDVDATGRVHHIIEKPKFTELKYMWAIALWTPTFTHFMHNYLAAIPPEHWQQPGQRELPIGDVIQAGINAGLSVEAEIFEQGMYLDIGTPDDLIRAVHQFTPSLEA
ncbi:dTDP-glucose pyrophosphorylase [Oscillatoria sp. FACHB-1407]|uniref:sugar phosphate nucleotidyltransferase n=1 Tax=Oscillatoria sp. FACHB-1407 TaxID=2692847 RepID=UPI0016853774|nr:sugar phosphate nucleotidyltransferase [Oscillatoria sp. FACHB-1407]MBD2460066.1 dTDP-glucose pyrophosphorylase [Oscillatoria sp. FACHB-1407]